jgi:hypothetical protein
MTDLNMTDLNIRDLSTNNLDVNDLDTISWHAPIKKTGTHTIIPVPGTSRIAA